MNRDERRAFVERHRTAIFGYNRRQDRPAMTEVYYVADGDDILVSTMAARAKAKAVERNQKVALCVLDEQWPPTYLQVYCDAKVETDHDATVDLATRIAGELGTSLPW
jgi:nitroimidazol reductase NimA-like FMN-containing flavoprotein (pyridoxamine 5'-phosphate oxidase superfamily)